MQILLITRKFPPSIGGMERFAFSLHRELAKLIDVKLLKWGKPNANQPVVLLVIILPYFFVRAVWALGRGGIDIIHVQDGVLAPLGWLLGRLFHKPWAVVIHGLDITYSHPIFKLVVPAAVARADIVFCISQAAATAAREAGVPATKIQIIPLGMSDDYYGHSGRPELLKRLQLPSDSQLLLTVGRLVARKGVAWFVSNVMPDLVAAYPNIIYLVAGEGAERPAIEAAITDRQLAKQVKLLGQVDDQLLPLLYNGIDVFVMPNLIIPGDLEGFGLVSLEAALSARPVVASDVEGIKQAIANGQNGVLVTPRDANGLKTEIETFLNDDQYAQRFGEQARNYTLQHYRWNTVADSYIKQYQRLIA